MSQSRAQVLMIFFSCFAIMDMIFFRSFGSTLGPFLSERVIGLGDRVYDPWWEIGERRFVTSYRVVVRTKAIAMSGIITWYHMGDWGKAERSAQGVYTSLFYFLAFFLIRRRMMSSLFGRCGRRVFTPSACLPHGVFGYFRPIGECPSPPPCG